MRVLITGGNRGIGAELAEKYRSAGHDVQTTARDGSGDLTVDVTDPAQISAMANALDGAALDLLVCNAGVYLDKGDDLDSGYAADVWARTYAVNVTGVFLTVQALLPNLRSARGKIAIVSSQMGSSTKAKGNSLIYRSSKAAVLNLGLNLSTGLQVDGIAVGIYHPGWVRTDMGGDEAEISREESADGLVACFDALSLETTGCFQTWDGRDHPL